MANEDIFKEWLASHSGVCEENVGEEKVGKEHKKIRKFRRLYEDFFSQPVPPHPSNIQRWNEISTALMLLKNTYGFRPSEMPSHVTKGLTRK